MTPRRPAPAASAVHGGERRQKVQAAEDAWNSRDPDRVALAYTLDSQWRNRSEFLTGRDEIHAFLKRKWERELDYALRKDLWAFTGGSHRGALPVRVARRRRPVVEVLRERTREFDEHGLMRRREASINDVAIVGVRAAHPRGAAGRRRLRDPAALSERGARAAGVRTRRARPLTLQEAT